MCACSSAASPCGVRRARRPGLISSRGRGARAGTRRRRPPVLRRASSAGTRDRARGSEPLLAVRRHDERTHEHLRPVAPVRAGIHADAAAGRAGDRAGELEPAEPGARARCRQTAFVAPPPARDRPLASTCASSPSSRMTSASTPSSAARTFEPSPTTTTSSPSPRANEVRPRARARFAGARAPAPAHPCRSS